MQTFLSSLMTYLTEADIALIREDLKFKRDASLRVNILRTTDSEALKSLSSIGISPIAFPDIAHAYTITRDEEYTIKGNPIFNSGRIYLQSISSQIPALCMDLSPGMNVLDACAAPRSSALRNQPLASPISSASAPATRRSPCRKSAAPSISLRDRNASAARSPASSATARSSGVSSGTATVTSRCPRSLSHCSSQAGRRRMPG